MSQERDIPVAVWAALPSPFAEGECFNLFVRSGFWKHVKPHMGCVREEPLWNCWLGASDVQGIKWLSSNCAFAETFELLKRASTIVEEAVRASFSLPLLVVYRTGTNEKEAASAPYTCVAVLRNGATFICKDTGRIGVVAATCYFSPLECRGYPRGSWYRVVAMRIVRQCRRESDSDLSRVPEAGPPLRNPNWPERDRFRAGIEFVTPNTWGFDGSGKPRPLSRFPQFPPETVPTVKLALRPRPIHEDAEDRK